MPHDYDPLPRWDKVLRDSLPRWAAYAIPALILLAYLLALWAVFETS